MPIKKLYDFSKTSVFLEVADIPFSEHQQPKAKIREAVAIKEAQAKKTDIFSYAPDSKVAEDYKEFIKEFING